MHLGLLAHGVLGLIIALLVATGCSSWDRPSDHGLSAIEAAEPDAVPYWQCAIEAFEKWIDKNPNRVPHDFVLVPQRTPGWATVEPGNGLLRPSEYGFEYKSNPRSSGVDLFVGSTCRPMLPRGDR